ncbi:MAG TPA: GAF domain-containing protein [Drouetiella sp.]
MMNMPVDTTDCDKEQIQFIESIQPFGTLVAVDKDHKVRYAAVSDGFDWTVSELLGKKIDSYLLDADRVFAAVANRSEPTSPLLIRTAHTKKWLSCIAHRQSELTIIELEFVPPEQIDIASLKFMSDRRDSLESYLSYIAENMRNVTGYDRVMIYKFGLDWHGEVVAESLKSTGYSFYGHHFPASDIPAPARQLFTQMWVRMIPDVDAKPVRIEGKANTQLDLSKSVLRAASNIHMQYLRNMDVAASLTMSLICDGKLWGLIACHHFTPKYLIAEQRAVCSLLAKVVSSRITTLSVSATIAATDKIAAVTTELGKQLTVGDLMESIRDNKRSLYQFLRADGFSFVSQDWTIVTEGHAPAPEELSLLVKVLDESNQELVYTDSIENLYPELSSLNLVAAGILGFKVAGNWFIWNRQEVVKSLLWAGDPNKPLYLNDHSNQLSPRSSFNSWKENVRGTSTSWEQYEVTAAERLKKSLVESLEKTKHVHRADAHAYLKLIRTSIDNQAAELQNQFKNLKLEGIELD